MLLLALAACGGGRISRDDAPSGRRVDAAACENFDIADAVPRREPRSKYGNPETYKVRGERYRVLRTSAGYRERGLASWYGSDFHGKRTSSGEPYDMHAMTAAHKTLPLPSYVLVTNLDNGRQAVLKVNDRGPFHDDRIIDLSYSAARKLCVVRNGTARVEVVALDPDNYRGTLVASRPTTATPAARTDDGGFGEEPAPAATVASADFDRPAVLIQEDSGTAPAAGAAAAGSASGFITEDEPAATPDTAGSPAAAALPPAQTEKVAYRPAASGSLYLQAGAFGQRDNAEALATRLREAGLGMVQVTGQDSGTLRVRLGPYPSGEVLEEDRQRLSSLGIDAHTIRE